MFFCLAPICFPNVLTGLSIKILHKILTSGTVQIGTEFPQLHHNYSDITEEQKRLSTRRMCLCRPTCQCCRRKSRRDQGGTGNVVDGPFVITFFHTNPTLRRRDLYPFTASHNKINLSAAAADDCHRAPPIDPSASAAEISVIYEQQVDLRSV